MSIKLFMLMFLLYNLDPALMPHLKKKFLMFLDHIVPVNLFISFSTRGPYMPRRVSIWSAGNIINKLINLQIGINVTNKLKLND